MVCNSTQAAEAGWEDTSKTTLFTLFSVQQDTLFLSFSVLLALFSQGAEGYPHGSHTHVL